MRPFAASLAATVLLISTTAPAFASDSDDMVSIPRSQWETFQINAKEFQRATNEIASLKAEIKSLKGGSNAVSPSVTAPAQPQAEPAVSKAPSTPDLATLPVLTPETVVPVVDLISHFQKDPVAAEARYKKKEFMLQGVVAGLDKSTIGRNYDIVFRQPGSLPTVRVRNTPPTGIAVTALIEDRTCIEGRTSGVTKRLAEVGQTVVLSCKCESLSGDRIVLSGLVSAKK